jgi:hypothetical protein
MDLGEDTLIKKFEKIHLILRPVKMLILDLDHTDLLQISDIMTETYTEVRQVESVIWFLEKIRGFPKNESLITTNNYITPNT